MENKWTGQENDLEKDALLDMQKKLTEILRSKNEIQRTNQEFGKYFLTGYYFTTSYHIHQYQQ